MRDVEQKAQGGKSGRDETQGNERIKKERVKRDAFADRERREGGGKMRMMTNEDWCVCVGARGVEVEPQRG